MQKDLNIFQKAGRLISELSYPRTYSQPHNLTKTEQKSRVFHKLKHYRNYRAELRMDAWKQAILRAEDPIRPRRLLLNELYREVLRDYHLLSQVRNRKTKTTGSPFALFPLDSEEPDYEYTRLLETRWFRQYLDYYLDSIFWGHSLMEFQPMVPAREGLPVAEEFKELVLFPRNHVVPEQGLVLLREFDEDGIPYREAPWDRYILEAGDPTDLGLLLPAVREVIWKMYSRTDWSEHSERFGMPLLAMATAGMNDREVEDMEEMAANFGRNSYALIDDIENLKMEESKQTDAYEIYLKLAQYCDEQMSKGIVGVNSISDEKSFSGSAEVHERQYNELVEDDLRRVSTHVNEDLLPFLIRHGYPLQGYEFKFFQLMNDDEDDTQDDGQNGGGNLDRRGNFTFGPRPKKKRPSTRR